MTSVSEMQEHVERDFERLLEGKDSDLDTHTLEDVHPVHSGGEIGNIHFFQMEYKPDSGEHVPMEMVLVPEDDSVESVEAKGGNFHEENPIPFENLPSVFAYPNLFRLEVSVSGIRGRMLNASNKKEYKIDTLKKPDSPYERDMSRVVEERLEPLRSAADYAEEKIGDMNPYIRVETNEDFPDYEARLVAPFPQTSDRSVEDLSSKIQDIDCRVEEGIEELSV